MFLEIYQSNLNCLLKYLIKLIYIIMKENAHINFNISFGPKSRRNS